MANEKLTLEEYFERMEELLDKARSTPFSSKKLIDSERMSQYLDEARINMPVEIKQAQDTQRDRQAILAQASKEADDIIRKAKEDAKKPLIMQSRYSLKLTSRLLTSSPRQRLRTRLSRTPFPRTSTSR